MNEKTPGKNDTTESAGEQPGSPSTQASPTTDRAAEKRAALIARKKARKKTAKKKAAQASTRKTARKKTVATKTVRGAPTGTSAETKTRPVKPKKISKKKAAAKKSPTRTKAAAPARDPSSNTAMTEPLSRVIRAMEELRAATQEYAYREMEAQRQAILEFQKTTRTTLRELESAALRTLRKLSS